MTEPNDFVKRVLAEHEEMRRLLIRLGADHDFKAVNEGRRCSACQAASDRVDLLQRVSEVSERRVSTGTPVKRGGRR